jgi:hypothetical protein
MPILRVGEIDQTQVEDALDRRIVERSDDDGPEAERGGLEAHVLRSVAGLHLRVADAALRIDRRRAPVDGGERDHHRPGRNVLLTESGPCELLPPVALPHQDELTTAGVVPVDTPRQAAHVADDEVELERVQGAGRRSSPLPLRPRDALSSPEQSRDLAAGQRLASVLSRRSPLLQHALEQLSTRSRGKP